MLRCRWGHIFLKPFPARFQHKYWWAFARLFGLHFLYLFSKFLHKVRVAFGLVALVPPAVNRNWLSL
jgi:hypothetical protein